MRTPKERSGNGKAKASPQFEFDDAPLDDDETEEDTTSPVNSSTDTDESKLKQIKQRTRSSDKDRSFQEKLQPFIDKLENQLAVFSAQAVNRNAEKNANTLELVKLVDMVKQQGEFATSAVNDRKKVSKEARRVEKEKMKIEQATIDEQTQNIITNLMEKGFKKNSAELGKQLSLSAVLNEMVQTKKLFKDAMKANQKHQEKQELAILKASTAKAQKNALEAQLELEKWKQQDYAKTNSAKFGHEQDYAKNGASGRVHRRRRSRSSSDGNSASSSPRQRFT